MARYVQWLGGTFALWVAAMAEQWARASLDGKEDLQWDVSGHGTLRAVVEDIGQFGGRQTWQPISCSRCLTTWSSGAMVGWYIRLVGRRNGRAKLADHIVSVPAQYTKKPLLRRD